MPFDASFALNIMLPLAEAAYDVTKLPAGWKLVSTIQPASFGLVAVSSDVCAIAIRGTETRGEWLADFDGIAVPNRFGKGMVHQGFQDQYSAIRASILAAIPLTSARIWITGHSLGAALATLLASDIALAGRPRLTYLWASPRVGWHDYADWFRTLPDPLYSIVNEWDLVPHEPPVVNGYEHDGAEIRIDGGLPPMGEEFLKIAHNLELSYRLGIARLIASQQLKAA